MCDLDINTSFVFMKPLLSFSVMLTGTLVSPGGYAMFAAELSSLCGSPSGAQRQHVGRTGPLTQQHRVFERFPPGRCECVDRSSEPADRSQQRCSLP